MSWFPKKWRNTKEKGSYYEQLCEQYLVKQGLIPVERNYLSRYGELDLVMREGETWVFVEVKFRRSLSYGGALYALSEQKKQRLQRTIFDYTHKHRLNNTKLRVDFVAVNGTHPPQFHWIKNVY